MSPLTTTTSATVTDPPAAAEVPVTPERFRQAMGRFATGVTAVCGTDATGAPIGIAANSFASVSLEPALVSFCVARTSSTWAELQASPSFAISFLADTQAEVCSQLARKGVDRFAGVPWSPAPSGAPVLDGALAWVDCTPWARYDGGDHEIVVGQVTALGLAEDVPEPLLFFQSTFRTLAP